MAYLDEVISGYSKSKEVERGSDAFLNQIKSWDEEERKRKQMEAEQRRMQEDMRKQQEESQRKSETAILKPGNQVDIFKQVAGQMKDQPGQPQSKGDPREFVDKNLGGNGILKFISDFADKYGGYSKEQQAKSVIDAQKGDWLKALSRPMQAPADILPTATRYVGNAPGEAIAALPFVGEDMKKKLREPGENIQDLVRGVGSVGNQLPSTAVSIWGGLMDLANPEWAVGKDARRTAEKMSKDSLDVAKSYSDIQQEFEGTKTRDTIPFKLGSTAGQLAKTVAISALASPVTAGIVAGAEQYGNTGQESYQKTGKFNQGAAAADAVVSGILERLPLTDKLGSVALRGGGGGILGRAMGGFLSEGAEEGSQQFASNLIAQKTFDPERDLSKGVVESAIYGGLAGAGGGVALHPKMASRVEQEALAEGRTPEEAKKIVADLNLQIQTNPEVRQQMQPFLLEAPQQPAGLLEAPKGNQPIELPGAQPSDLVPMELPSARPVSPAPGDLVDVASTPMQTVPNPTTGAPQPASIQPVDMKLQPNGTVAFTTGGGGGTSINTDNLNILTAQNIEQLKGLTMLDTPEAIQARDFLIQNGVDAVAFGGDIIGINPQAISQKTGVQFKQPAIKPLTQAEPARRIKPLSRSERATIPRSKKGIVDALATEMRSYQKETGGVQTLRTEASYGNDNFRRESTNPEWYRKFYADNKRAPNKADIREIAEQMLENNDRLARDMLGDEAVDRYSKLNRKKEKTYEQEQKEMEELIDSIPFQKQGDDKPGYHKNFDKEKFKTSLKDVQKYFDKTLGDNAPNVFNEVDAILKDNPDALAYTWNGLMNIADETSDFTINHEYGHHMIEMVGSKQQQQKIYQIVRKLGDSREDVRERAADEWAKYIRDRGKGYGQTTVQAKLKGIFNDLFSSIKKMFGKGSELRNIFDDIYSTRKTATTQKAKDQWFSSPEQAGNKYAEIAKKAYEQSTSPQFATKEGDMMVYHNISSDKLLKAAQAGGLSAPSIAVTKKDIPFTDFGDITLIGDKDLIDPKNKDTHVFSTDVYTPRVPEPDFNITPQEKAKFFEGLSKEEKDAVQIDQNSDFLEMNRTLKFINGDIDNHKKYGSTQIPIEISRLKEIRDNLSSLLNDPRIEVKKDQPSGIIKDLIKMDRAVKDIYIKSNDAYDFRLSIENHSSELYNQMNDYAERLYPNDDEPYFKLLDEMEKDFSDRLPWNAENITKKIKADLHMVGGDVRGQEGFKAPATVGASTKFTDINHIKSNKHRLQAGADNIRDNNLKKLNQVIEDAMFHPENYDYDTRDEIMNDIASIPGTLTEENVKAKLGEWLDEDRMRFVPLLDFEKLNKVMEEDIRNVPADYFEAKLLRPVDMSEFKGAIVPEDVSPQVLKLLQEKLGKENVIVKTTDDVTKVIDDNFSGLAFQRAATAEDIQNLAPTEKLEEVIKSGRDIKESRKEKTKKFFSQANEQLIDKYSPVRKLSKEYKKLTGKNLEFEKDPYSFMRLHSGIVGKINDKLESFTKILEGVKDKKALEQAGVLRRILTDRSGIKNPLTQEEATQAQAELRAKLGEEEWAKIDKAVDDVIAYHDDMLKTLQEEGIISQDSYDAIKAKNQNYFGKFEVIDYLLDNNKNMRAGKSFSVASQDVIKKQEGTEKSILSPIESTIKQTAKIIDLISRNKAAKALTELSSVEGMESTIMPLKSGDTVPSGYEKVSAFRDGVKQDYAVPKDIGEAFKQMNKQQADIVTKVARRQASWLRSGATSLNLGFAAISNPIRDLNSLAVNSKNTNLLNMGVYWTKGLAQAIGRGKYYNEFMRSGGGQSGYFSQEDVPTMARDIMESKAKKIGRTVTSPKQLFGLIPAVESVGNKVELAPRLAEYIAGRKKGKSPEQAAFDARNVTVDFGKSGNVGQIMNQWVPFLNARAQGSVNTINAVRTQPLKAGLAIGVTAILPAILTFMHNMKEYEEEWRKIPGYVKDNNFIIIYGKETDAEGNLTQVIKIPKGDAAKIATNPTERFMEFMYNGKPLDFAALSLEMLSNISPVDFVGEEGKFAPAKAVGGVMPPGIKALVEGLTNYSFFRDAPLVSQKLSNLPAREQVYDSTSEGAKLLGNLTGVSPIKIDNAIRDMSGGFFGQFSAKGLAQGTIGRLSGAPGNALENQFYSTYSPLQQDRNSVSNQINQALEVGDINKAKNLASGYNDKVYKTFADKDLDPSKLGEDIQKKAADLLIDMEDKNIRLRQGQIEKNTGQAPPGYEKSTRKKSSSTGKASKARIEKLSSGISSRTSSRSSSRRTSSRGGGGSIKRLATSVPGVRKLTRQETSKGIARLKQPSTKELFSLA